MAVNDKALESALRFDPLAAVEEETGLSCRDNDAVAWMGMARHYVHGQRKRELLKASDDTTLDNQLSNYLRIVEAEGFRLVGQHNFTRPDRDVTESLYLFWHNDGILLVFDTYMRDRVNGGHFYYNWRPDDQEHVGSCYRWVSSGRLHETPDNQWIWSGDHDCREALRFRIRKLRENGKFVKPWVDQPFLWLCHHGDDSDQYARLRDERIAALPEDVRSAITVVAR